ncbi:MAG: hypothetical protein L0206_12115 [Actinobacteria bacterium]|nr:hypothetical protein [Actinomycetota bacterium]
MRAELYRPDAPESPVAIANWSDGRAHLEVIDRTIPGLERLLKANTRRRGRPLVAPAGDTRSLVARTRSYAWFRAALLSRAEPSGLKVRFVAGRIVGGWDPAAAYRPFEEQIERLTS